MRIAITGATGFLGSHLLDRVLADGHSAVVVVRGHAQAEALAKRGARVLRGNLTAPIDPGDARADVFVHAAALSSNWGAPAAFFAANVRGTQNAILLARRMGVRRFIQISSPSIYFRFRDQVGVTEDAELPKPVNAYAASKRRAEDLVREAADLHPLILRPRGIYGRGDVALLPRLVRAAERGSLPLLRDGRAVTDITHVDDVVSAVLAAAEAEPSVGGVAINISGGQALRVVDIAEKACAHAGVKLRWRRLPAPLAFAAVRLAEIAAAALPGRTEPIATAYSLGVLAYSQTLDISRARAMIGWRPSVGFEEGLGRL